MAEAAELTGLADVIRAVVATDEGAVPDALQRELRQKAAAAFDSATLAPAAADMLLDATDGVAEPAKSALLLAYMARNDREFTTQTVPGLAVGRSVFMDLPATAEELGVAFRATEKGAIIPDPLDEAEQVVITIACELQVLVVNDLPEEDAERLHKRGYDEGGLAGSLSLQYGLRAMRRVAWGIAMLTFTERRAIAVIYEDEVPGSRSSPERLAMPLATIAGDGSSVVVVSCERAVFEDCEVATGFLQSRLPYINVTGDCSLAFNTYRVLDPSDRLVRPPKGQVAAAVRTFVGNARS